MRLETTPAGPPPASLRPQPTSGSAPGSAGLLLDVEPPHEESVAEHEHHRADEEPIVVAGLTKDTMDINFSNKVRK